MSSSLEAAAPAQTGSLQRWRRPVAWCLAFVLGMGAVLAVAGLVIARRLQPMVRGRLLHIFQQRFNSPVTLADLQVHYNGAIQVDGRGLEVQSVLNGVPGDPAHPMLRVQEFHCHLSPLEALRRAPRIHHVRIRGVQLDLPAGGATKRTGPEPGSGVDLEYAEVDDAHIRFAAADNDRAPFLFDLPHLVFRGVSRSRPIRFHAVVDNGPPLGITESDGVIGPWDFDDPRLTPIRGTLHFQDKDVSSVRGLRGRITLNGRYTGSVGSLQAEGTTTDPAFALDVSSRPVAMHTTFAVTMQPSQSALRIDRLQGAFGASTFVCSGAAIKDRATGMFRLDVHIEAPSARVEDALQLGTHTRTPVLRGTLSFRGRMQMSAGPESVSRKLSIESTPFQVSAGTFGNPAMQQTFEELAERAQGDPEDATKERAAHVSARIQGRVSLRNATVHFATVRVISPGSRADLHGSFSLDGAHFDFDGVVHTEAKLSHMTKGVKRVLLTPLNHLLGHSRKHGAGASLPIHIHGSGDTAHVDARLGGLWVKAPGTH